jgi:hypothetical protein
MLDNENCLPVRTRTPWNRGKLIGARPPLRPKHVWSTRTRLLLEGRVRDLAMFNLAIDSKLRAAMWWLSRSRMSPPTAMRSTVQPCGKKRPGDQSNSS